MEQHTIDVQEQVARPRLAYTELMAKPVWDFVEFAHVIGAPHSTLLQVFEQLPPAFFTLGRRRFILRKDALAWLQDAADRFPHTARRNQRRKTAQEAV
jgi:hypothetical protein